MIFIFKEKGTAEAVIIQSCNLQNGCIATAAFPSRHSAVTQPHEGVHFPAFSVPYARAGRVPSLNILLAIVGLSPSLFPESILLYDQTTPYAFSSLLARLPPALLAPWCPPVAGWLRGTYSPTSPEGQMKPCRQPVVTHCSLTLG